MDFQASFPGIENYMYILGIEIGPFGPAPSISFILIFQLKNLKDN